MDYRWKPDAHDDVILRSTTEFVLKALERAAQGSEITIDVDDKGMYEARDKSARFIPIIPFGEKQPTQYKSVFFFFVFLSISSSKDKQCLSFFQVHRCLHGGEWSRETQVLVRGGDPSEARGHSQGG